MRRKASAEAENPFWITYSDLLSSLFMISLVLLFAFMGIATVMAKQLQEKEQQLELEQKKLEVQKIQLEEKHKEANEDAKSFQVLLGDLKSLELDFKEEGILVDQDNGDLIIPDTMLFKAGKSVLQKVGQDFLKKFIPRYAKVVTKPEYEGIVKGIVFEGHADTSGLPDRNANYFKNMNLTTERGESVNRFVFSKINFPISTKERLRGLVMVAGRSDMEAFTKLSEKDKKRAHLLIQEKKRRVTIRIIYRNLLTEQKAKK